MSTRKKSVHSVSYGAGLKCRKSEKIEIENMLYWNKIKSAQKKWMAPIILAPKKNGTLPFCVDFCKPNAVAKWDAYPLLLIDGCFESLGKAAILFTIDPSRGRLQVDIDEADRGETVFTSSHGLYRFIRMTFGTRNTSSTFQSTLDVILSMLRWQLAFVYLDDIVIIPNFCNNTTATSERYSNFAKMWA